MIASSRVGKPRVVVPKDSRRSIDGVAMSPIRVDDDLLPTSMFAIRLTRLDQPAGWLAGEFSLEEMWRMVDQIRIGEHGFAMVVAPGRRAGRARRPRQEGAGRADAQHERPPAVRRQPRARSDARPVSQEYTDEDGRSELGVAARIAPLGWTVIVEQPTARSLRQRHRAAAAAGRRDLDRAARDDHRRLPVRPDASSTRS